MKKLICSNELKKYEVVYVNSADKSAYITVEAKDRSEASKKVKKMLGRECYRIVDIYEV